MSGQRDNDVVIRCNAGSDLAGFTVSFKVATCSKYENGAIPSRWDYEKTAWLIDVTVKRGKAGFQDGVERTVKIFAPGKKSDD